MKARSVGESATLSGAGSGGSAVRDGWLESQASLAADQSAAIQESFEWLRADALRVLLFTLAALAWLAIVPYLGHPDDVWPGWGIPVSLLLLIVVCYALRGHSYHLASGLLIGGLAAVAGLSALTGTDRDTATIFFFIPVILIAGTLRGTRSVVTIAVLASVVLAIQASRNISSFAAGSTHQIVLIIWLTVLTTWLTTRNLYTTLDWLWHSQKQVTANLDEARRHRGELAQALKQLADATYRLERMNYALNIARLQAEEARRLKAQFAAQVSHELRTPINLIVGFSDVMLNAPTAYGGARLPTTYQADLQTLHLSAKHLQGLIDDILDLSQLDARAMPLMRETVSIESVVGEAVAAIRPLLERKNLSITVHIAPELPPAYIDSLRVRQVLLNLLSNASRYTTVGGITIRVRAESDTLLITVSDTGQGIDPREIPHLFEAFHRVSPSPTDRHEGWGLGLAVCKQFVELHGGTIRAASEGVPGRGTIFTISLALHTPLDEPRVDGQLRGRVVDRLTASEVPPTVVVADPDPHVVNLYRRHLHHYRVHGASGEREAAELAQVIGAHAVLASAPPPAEASAWFQHWFSLAADRGLRIIGCPMPSSHQLARTVGLVDFLVKPVARDTLLAAVERANPRARTIAVIDDDPGTVRLLNRMLRSTGKRWRIRRAYDGDEGLELIRQARPDVVLLDLALPCVDGLSLLETVRSDPSLAHVAVVAVSATDVDEVLRPTDGRFLALVADRPLTTTQMLRGVRGLLDFLPLTDGTDTAPAPGEAPAASAAFG